MTYTYHFNKQSNFTETTLTEQLLANVYFCL